MDLALDSSGDLDITDGKLRLVSGYEGTAQRLQMKLSTWLGEWYLDQRVGVPFVREILVKNPNMRAIKSILREIITKDPGVVSINKMEFTLDSARRILSVDLELTGTEGEPFTLAFSSTILRSEQ